MNKIVFVTLLIAAAACSKKADCDTEIAKGMAAYSQSVKSRPEVDVVANKLKEAFTERCKADQWPPEIVTCFGTITDMKSIVACQNKLTKEQQTKLRNEIREAMMSSMGTRMPQDAPGHPSLLHGKDPVGGAAPAAPASADTAAAPAPPAAPAAPGSAPAPASGSDSAKPSGGGGW